MTQTNPCDQDHSGGKGGGIICQHPARLMAWPTAVVGCDVDFEQGVIPTEALKEELKKWVAKEIGSLAKLDEIRCTDTLPKTRSGKIMRRLLRELASSGEVKGDTTTLEDFGVIAKL